MTDLKKYVVDEIIGGFALNPLVALKEVKTKPKNRTKQKKKPQTFSDSN